MSNVTAGYLRNCGTTRYVDTVAALSGVNICVVYYGDLVVGCACDCCILGCNWTYTVVEVNDRQAYLHL